MELFEVPIGIAIIANICESVDLHDRIDPWIKWKPRREAFAVCSAILVILE